MNEKARRLRAARITKGLTQERIAKELHIAPTTYRAWEQNSEPRNLETAARLCNYLNISLDYYVNGVEFCPSLTESQKTLIAITEELPPQLQDALLNVLTLIAEHLHLYRH